MRIGSIGAVIGAVLAASLLAACGGSAGHPLSSSSSKAPDTTAAYILPRMETAVHAATSVHMAGSALSGSQQVSFDLSFYGKTGLSGTITEGGATFTVLTANGKTYIRADKAFLKLAKLPAVACATICGKYIELPGAEASQITGALSLPSLVSQAFSKLPATTSLDTSEVFVPATDNGQAVLRFSGGGDTIEVAGSGTPFPVLIAASGTSITFSQWNAVTPPQAPPARKVLNLSQL
jgi:hypothetical protein